MTSPAVSFVPSGRNEQREHFGHIRYEDLGAA